MRQRGKGKLSLKFPLFPLRHLSPTLSKATREDKVLVSIGVLGLVLSGLSSYETRNGRHGDEWTVVSDQWTKDAETEDGGR